MKESIRAAREEVALKRQVEAVKSLAGDEQAKALEALSGPARYPDYNRLMQQELIAEILEDLAGIGGESDVPDQVDPDLSFLSEEQAEALHDGGFTNPDEMREATDEDLEAVSHIGKATIEKIRSAFGSEVK